MSEFRTRVCPYCRSPLQLVSFNQGIADDIFHRSWLPEGGKGLDEIRSHSELVHSMQCTNCGLISRWANVVKAKPDD
jgi:uncharacterized protein YbaR (Trm112 family)